MNLKLTFSKLAKKDIMNIFDKTVNADGCVVEKKDPSQKVLAIDGNELNYDEFAGIKKGSEIFIKSDLNSIVKLADILSSR